MKIFSSLRASHSTMVLPTSQGEFGESSLQGNSADAQDPATSKNGRKLHAGWIFRNRFRRRHLNRSGGQIEALQQPQSIPGQTPYPRSSPPPLEAEISGPLGLRVIHQPKTTPLVDIIFIHGLGGGSKKTWSKDPRDPGLFWPERWLPSDPEIEKARILSFGYNASFLPGAPRSIYNIGDFAKELLNEMKFGTDNGVALDIGDVPIIFVVHSMGGLVMKKAYLFGQNDKAYKDIVSSISAVIFLATPHRGSNLADDLGRLLKVLFQPPRDFVNDLKTSSPALEDLNEQFRHVAPNLSIWSFYETLVTPAAHGLLNLMVLEKSSSVLGYANEISRPLNANHHTICKYSSPHDSNYISVRNALSFLVKSVRLKDATTSSIGALSETKLLDAILAISSSPEEDLNSIRRLWTPGTCDWLLQEPGIQSWLEMKMESCVTWFCAPPGCGKSTLAAHIISHLRGSGLAYQYFFFKFDDPDKRSMGTFLRSIAYQIARDFPAFKRSLLELANEGLKLEKADPIMVWNKLFEYILFAMDLSVPLYWVVDGLDECDTPKVLPQLLRGFIGSNVFIRILIVSRKTEYLTLEFGRLASSLQVERIEKDGSDFNFNDIHIFVEREIKHLRGSDTVRHRVSHDIESRAQGNFLWTRLVLEEILNCHTEDDIHKALDNIPADMDKLYRRMEQVILSNPRKANIALAKVLLQWTICASRLLTVEELSQALRPEFPEILDIRRSIQDICGQFLIVKTTGHVTIIHKTARDYLLRPATITSIIDVAKAHEELFIKSISEICDHNLRLKLTHDHQALFRTKSFLLYSATSWMFHLRKTRAASDEIFKNVLNLFNNLFVLIWIQTLALVGQLEILVLAAQALATFTENRRKLNLIMDPSLHRLSDIEFLERWTVDLTKLGGKFGKQLTSDPAAIYELIPLLCPEDSVIHQQFHEPDSAKVIVRGILNTSWCDNLAKIDLPNGERALQIACAAQNLAILGSTEAIYIWNTSNFTEICTLMHQEPITHLCFNSKGNTLVSCGLQSTKFWAIPSGELLSSVPNPTFIKLLAINFTENDSKLMLGSNDCEVRYLRIKDLEAGWQIANSNLLKENSKIGGTAVKSPIPDLLLFNEDGTQVAASYAGFPLSVWAINGGYCVGRCRRAKEYRNLHALPSTSWHSVYRFTWNPVSGHIIGIYKADSIFKWHPITGENHETLSSGDEIAASPDGKLFVTSNSDGVVKIWNFQSFTVIYQLSLADLVTGLAFSPDSMRLYDLRWSSVNAWEPSGLIRFLDNNDSFRNPSSEYQLPAFLSHMSEASVAQFAAVGVIAAGLGTSRFCVGNDKGVICLFDTQMEGTIELHKFLDFFPVSHIAWSQDARHVAVADLGGNIIIKNLVALADGNDNTKVRSLAPPTMDMSTHGIRQILFNYDSTLLLVLSEYKGQIWSLNDEAVIATCVFEDNMNRRWLQHPTQKSKFLGFGSADIRVFRWHDFSEFPRLYFQENQLRRDSHTMPISTQIRSTNPVQFSKSANKSISSSIVNKAFLTQDGNHVMVQLKITSAKGRITKELLIFDVSSFPSDEVVQITSKRLSYAFIPQNISTIIEIPLGILPDFGLVFLDKDLWFCTFQLNVPSDKYEIPQRHYFIPRDWASSQSIEQCCMMENGTILCPKEDTVAVIKCDLENSGF